MQTTGLNWRRGSVLLLIAVILLVSVLPVAASPRTHVVRRGEHLTGIAVRYGTTVSALVQANNIRNRNFIYVGQILTIPGDGGGGDGDDDGDDNDDGDVTPTGIHVVRAGEILSRIALNYGTTVWAIASLNGLRNINVIYIGQRLRIPGKDGDDDPTPHPTPPPTGVKTIDVDLSDQVLRALVGSTEVRRCIVSTGRSPYITVTGQFRISTKYRAQTMAGPGYYLPNVPHVMYFYRGYAIHGAYWHDKFGTPTSHGCVNLTLPDAEWMYNWAPLGTLVVIHW